MFLSLQIIDINFRYANFGCAVISSIKMIVYSYNVVRQPKDVCNIITNSDKCLAHSSVVKTQFLCILINNAFHILDETYKAAVILIRRTEREKV
jgi:hypothetical protein